MSPLISVVMCVYNGGEYLQLSIDSIISQTYRNLQLIIVNDGSTDNTVQILSNYTDPRIKVVHNEKNEGLIFSLNRGVSMSDGEYIARMDADDIATPTRLESQLDFIERNNLDIVGAYAKVFGVNAGRRVMSYPTTHLELKFRLLFGSAFAHPLVFARADCLKSNPYSSEYPCAEDYELWCRLYAAGYKFGNDNKILLHYRVHPGQVSQAKSDIQNNSVMKALSIFSEKALETETYSSFNSLSFCREPVYGFNDFENFVHFMRNAVFELSPSAVDIEDFFLFFVRKLEKKHFGSIVSLFVLVNINKQRITFPRLSSLFQLLLLTMFNLNKRSILYRLGRYLYR